MKTLEIISPEKAVQKSTGLTITVTRGRIGWIVEEETRWQGGFNGFKARVHFSPNFPKTAEITNEFIDDLRMQIDGQETASCRPDGTVTILRRGQKIG